MGERIKKIKEALTKDKKMMLIIISAVAGVIFLVASEFLVSDKNESASDENITADDYAEMIEDKLTTLVSSIEGAGEAVVMVTVETGEENVYAKEVKSDEESNENKSSSKYEYEYIVIKSGTSSENGMLLKVIEPNIRGVAIVCDGGENAAVRENIINAVSAVLDIKSNKISVSKRQK